MTRIISGDLGGRRLVTPAGQQTRPTSDRVREALFGALSAARDLREAVVLDLYAGSGAVGLEACSRGASRAVFVESHAKTAQLIRRNISTLGLKDRAEVIPASVSSVMDKPPMHTFDVIFADPPYALDNDQLGKVLAQLVAGGWVAADADVIVERASRSGAVPWPQGLAEVRSRRYGESTLWYGRGSWT